LADSINQADADGLLREDVGDYTAALKKAKARPRP
jgi:hypothetical protein